MERSITAEQITQWFVLGTQFANVTMTGDAAKEKSEGASSGQDSPTEPADQGSMKNETCDGGSRTKTAEFLRSSPPPPLANYEYPSLPITKNREELISVIENNPVVIIHGATGSGKTTQLPQFILDHYSQKNTPCNIVVTQPRKIGATSIARWVARERKCTLGSLVGYQVGLEKMATEHTRLIYMTTGVLLQKLVSSKTLTEYSHIFVDEVHERSHDLDFLLLVMRKLLHSNPLYVKIILMSATINCREFAEYFSRLVRGHMTPACVFEVEGAPYAIEQYYLDDLKSFIPHSMPPQSSDDPHVLLDMYHVAVRLIQSFDEMDQRKTKREGSLNLTVRASVLVFLPGLKEIICMQEALVKLALKRLQVYPIHSTVTLEEQNSVFVVPIPGYRKVILSTNITESSVTVPDVKYVIDFCLARHLVCDKETNYQSLRLTWASKTNCNQRKGRAGRVSKGYCYRLVTKEFWEKVIPDFMTPAMLLTPLSSIMLKVKLLDMGEPRALLSTALSPPNFTDIVKTVLQLKQMGALSARSDGWSDNDDGELTFLGRVLALLPVDLHLGKMIVLGHVFGCLHEALIIAASLSLKTFFSMPSLQQLAGYRSKLVFANGSPSDAIAVVNAFKAWYTAKNKGQLRHPKIDQYSSSLDHQQFRKDELEWGKEKFIQIKRIREVAELYDDLKRRVSQFNMQVAENPPPADYTSLHRQRFILELVIAGAFYPNYFFQGAIDEELASRELCGHDPKTTVMVRNLPPYSFLYYKQLRSLFRQCGQVKAISFDGSRAYVEFCKTSRGSGVLSEVSLALLLAHQNPGLELFVYPSNEVEDRTAGRNTSHMKYARVNVDCQNDTVHPVGVLSSSIDPEKLPPNQMFVVNITEVVEVGQFWGFQADEASMEKQRHLTSEINTRKLLPVGMLLYPNLLCLAPYSESNEQSLYYRAKILHLRGNSVEVFFLDFGNTLLVSCSSIREIPADLMSLPFQAQEFCIAGMRPSALSLISGALWSSRALDRFITLVKGHSLMVKLYSILHGVMHVELLINTESSSVSVADTMVKEGHAIKAKPSYDAKQNHDVIVSLYKDLMEGTYVPNATSSSWTDRKEEEKQLIDTLLTYLSKNSEPHHKTKVLVRGPTSPLKVNFHRFSHAIYKSVYVDRFSVNSMALNENPQDKHQRMLVAGFVNISSTGSHVLLNKTALMPDIPGLPALLIMLFSPAMELRTNAERTCYTGALCGLGWNEHNGEALLPEHDIELAFDVKFDVEDIVEINALRAAINLLVCEGPNGPLDLGPDRIRFFQENCTERLIRLCSKSPQREAVYPVYYEKPGKWDQVSPSLKMAIVNRATRRSRGVLFQLHPITLLNN